MGNIKANKNAIRFNAHDVCVHIFNNELENLYIYYILQSTNKCQIHIIVYRTYSSTIIIDTFTKTLVSYKLYVLRNFNINMKLINDIPNNSTFTIII